MPPYNALFNSITLLSSIHTYIAVEHFNILPSPTNKDSNREEVTYKGPQGESRVTGDDA